MLGQGAMSLKSFKKLLYLFVAKKANWYDAVNFHATQKGEADDILKQFGNAKIYIAPNVNAGVEHQNISVKKKNEIKLVYLSRIARVKNLHFALQCLMQMPAPIKVTYTIYGNAEDVEYVNECKKIVEQLPSNVVVEWKGELEFYDVQQTLRKYEVLFLPTLNENFGHSIVEAFLCGCGVIISDQTPWRGLRKAGCGADLPLTATDLFLEEICRIAGLDAEAFRDLSLASNRYIRARIDQEKIKKQYLQMFNDCTQNRPK
jgi:glycosyltransferase involved in cell wall biosynthesis